MRPRTLLDTSCRSTADGRPARPSNRADPSQEPCGASTCRRTSDAARHLAMPRPRSPYDLAIVFAGIGNHDSGSSSTWRRLKGLKKIFVTRVGIEPILPRGTFRLVPASNHSFLVAKCLAVPRWRSTRAESTGHCPLSLGVHSSRADRMSPTERPENPVEVREPRSHRRGRVRKEEVLVNPEVASCADPGRNLAGRQGFRGFVFPFVSVCFLFVPNSFRF